MAIPATPASPAILVDRVRLAANIHAMQAVCDANGLDLRPHVKTHKSIAIARLQATAGADGFTCAKLGEAEALLPSGMRGMFVAHSLVDPGQAGRVAALAERLDDLRVAVTSELHQPALERVAAATGRRLAVMMAVDAGLGREGVRDSASANRLAGQLARSPHLELTGFYSHEGFMYGVPPDEQSGKVRETIDRLAAVRDAVDPKLPIWPGCSVSARTIALKESERVQGVRPGAYVFGDLNLTEVSGVMTADTVALHVLATVIDQPEPGLALIDAGSKTFSSDRTPDGIHGRAADGRDLAVFRCNEEHGYVRGAAVGALKIGERVLFTPAHVCPVVNLTDELLVVEDDAVVDTWKVEARGCTR